MEKHNVVIVGAGPGGLRAARRLAPHKDVLILEKRKEEESGNRVCTGLLTRPALDMLPKSLYKEDIMDNWWDDLGPDSKDIRMNGGALYPTTRVGITDFSELMGYLRREAKRFGAEIRDQSPVKKVDRKKNKVILKDGKEIGYDYLIGADGPTSIVRGSATGRHYRNTWAGYVYRADNVNIPCVFHSIRNPPEEFGMPRHALCGLYTVPHENYTDFLYMFPSGSYPERRFGSCSKELNRKLCEKYGIDLRDVRSVGREPFPPFPKPIFRRSNIFLVGDAGCYMNAWSGLGLYPALKTGEIAARAIIDEKYNYKKDPDLRTIIYVAKVSTLDLFLNSFSYKSFLRIYNILERMHRSSHGYSFLCWNREISRRLGHYWPFAYELFIWIFLVFPDTTISWRQYKEMGDAVI